MKRTLLILSLIVGWIANAPSAAALGTVQITVEKSVDAGARPRAEGVGSEAMLVSKVKYEIKLVNGTFANLAGLTVDYLIFVEHQKVGRKKSEDTVSRVTGSQAIPLLANKSPQIVSTKEIELKKSNLVGNYYFPDGGRLKAADNVKGVWVRVSQGGKIVGEYTNPSTVTTRGWNPK